MGKIESIGSATFFMVDEAKLTEVISRVFDEKMEKIIRPAAPRTEPNLLDEYIHKSEVRGKILASSTLWKHERKGDLKTYAIGGKKFYKRSEIESLMKEVKR